MCKLKVNRKVYEKILSHFDEQLTTCKKFKCAKSVRKEKCYLTVQNPCTDVFWFRQSETGSEPLKPGMQTACHSFRNIKRKIPTKAQPCISNTEFHICTKAYQTP